MFVFYFPKATTKNQFSTKKNKDIQIKFQFKPTQDKYKEKIVFLVILPAKNLQAFGRVWQFQIISLRKSKYIYGYQKKYVFNHSANFFCMLIWIFVEALFNFSLGFGCCNASFWIPCGHKLLVFKRGVYL